MRAPRILLSIAAASLLASCAGSPSSPVEPIPPTYDAGTSTIGSDGKSSEDITTAAPDSASAERGISTIGGGG